MMTLAGLFLGAFLAASLLPFSSEVMLAAALSDARFPAPLVIAVASAGNTLGACLNWALGRYLLHWEERRWFPVSRPQLATASARFNRFGLWSLLFSWVPVVGDPLTFAAGALKVRFAIFLPLVAGGKIARYVLVAWVAQ